MSTTGTHPQSRNLYNRACAREGVGWEGQRREKEEGGSKLWPLAPYCCSTVATLTLPYSFLLAARGGTLPYSSLLAARGGMHSPLLLSPGGAWRRGGTHRAGSVARHDEAEAAAPAKRCELGIEEGAVAHDVARRGVELMEDLGALAPPATVGVVDKG